MNPERTLARRNNYVLPRMAEEGFITRQAGRGGREEAPGAARAGTDGPSRRRRAALLLVEDVRRAFRAGALSGAAALYEAGPAGADDARRRPAARRRTPRSTAACGASTSGGAPTAVRGGTSTAAGRHRRDAYNAALAGRRPLAAGDIVPAVVSGGAQARPPGSVRIRIGDRQAGRPARQRPSHGRGKTNAADLFSVGDLIEVAVGALEEGRVAHLTLEQAPIVEGAMVALDNRTGQVRAMVGGVRLHAQQVQPGHPGAPPGRSLFKPVVYAAAIDQGFTAETVFIDEPCPTLRGPNQPPYRPLNYDRKFEGPVTLRHALEDSRNIPAVKAIEAVGPDQVVGYARQLGLTGNYPPYSFVRSAAIRN